MRKRMYFNRYVLPVLFCAVGMITVFAVSTAQADVVAAWSFDTNTITTDGGGNITGVADATGNHDATVQNGTFPGSDSVAGQFGEALRFNGDNNLQFPNLTELMTANGAPSYTISIWVKWLNATAPGGATPFQTLGDWGNASAGTATESRFVYAFGPNGGASVRGQTRRGSGNGADIFGHTTGTSTVNDGQWHMLTWTFDTTAGSLTVYFDGAFVETFQAGAPYQLADSASAVGTLGLKGDSHSFLNADTQLDEILVFNEILDITAIQDLYNDGFSFTTNQAQTPSPGNGATLIPVDGTILTWGAPDDPNDETVTYDVYFGTTVPDANCDGNPQVASDQAATMYDPGTLAFDTTYYWRVDVIDPNGGGNPILVKGDCWSFTTCPAEPVILEDPEGVTVDAGGTAVFTVSATCGATGYQWKKDGVDLTDGGDISGATTDTLTITNVELADEGNYSVVVSNTAGSDTSADAQLMTCRLVGHWKLDGNLLDSVQDTVAGAPTHDGQVIASSDTGEAYVTGIDGMAYDFAGDPNSNVIAIPDPDFFNFYTSGLTVSAWVNREITEGNRGVVSKQAECCGQSNGWNLWIDSGGEARFIIRGDGESGNSSAEQVGLGEWHMITGTYDPVVAENRFYFDGVLTETVTGAPVASNEGLVVFGAEDGDTTGDLVSEEQYAGWLDDVRIYSCALTPIEVATLYTDIAGSTICVDPAGLGDFDQNGDCKVDVMDLSLWSSRFLDCNRIPPSDCN